MFSARSKGNIGKKKVNHAWNDWRSINSNNSWCRSSMIYVKLVRYYSKTSFCSILVIPSSNFISISLFLQRLHQIQILPSERHFKLTDKLMTLSIKKLRFESPPDDIISRRMELTIHVNPFLVVLRPENIGEKRVKK